MYQSWNSSWIDMQTSVSKLVWDHWLINKQSRLHPRFILETYKYTREGLKCNFGDFRLKYLSNQVEICKKCYFQNFEHKTLKFSYISKLVLDQKNANIMYLLIGLIHCPSFIKICFEVEAYLIHFADTLAISFSEECLS